MRAWIWLLVTASCGPPSSPVGKTLSYFEDNTLRSGAGCGNGIAVDSERYVWRSGYCLSAAPPSTHYVGRVEADRFASIKAAFDALPSPTDCPSGAKPEYKVTLTADPLKWTACKDSNGALLSPYNAAIAALDDAAQAAH